MAISSPPTSSCLLLLLSAVAIFLAVSPSAVTGSNLLLTGQELGSDESITNGHGATFIMQGDCNLVLYNKVGGFQSNTHGNGVNCVLNLNDGGQLIIKSNGGLGNTVWTSSSKPSPNKGQYAAVVRPDGQVGVYGPLTWATTPKHKLASVTDTKEE